MYIESMFTSMAISMFTFVFDYIHVLLIYSLICLIHLFTDAFTSFIYLVLYLFMDLSSIQHDTSLNKKTGFKKTPQLVSSHHGL